MAAPLQPSHLFHIDTWKKFGIHVKDTRLVFQDPSGKLLTHEVKRWHPEKNQVESKQGEKGLIVGIKTHTKATHVFYEVLYYLTFGLIKKSIQIVLDNKKIYLSSGSLQKWRRLNSETLLSLGILQPSNSKNFAKIRQEELTALNQLLKTPLQKRPERKKAVVECCDSFELAAKALMRAKAKMNAGANLNPNMDNKQVKNATHAIAAFYILLNAEIKLPACGQEVLQIGERLEVQNFAASEEKLRKLADMGRDELDNRIASLENERKLMINQGKDVAQITKQETKARQDLQLFETIRVVYEDTGNEIKRRFLNKTPDLFSSLQTRNNPVLAKKLLNEIFKENEDFALNFTDKIIDFFMKGKEISGKQTREKKFFHHILSLGQALQEQFTPRDPGLILKNIMQNSLFKTVSIMTEENLYDGEQRLVHQIGTLSAWQLLKSTTEAKMGFDGSKTFTCNIGDILLPINFPHSNFYDNVECTKQAPLPFINALAGKFPCDDPKTPLCYYEAYDIARSINQELFKEEVIILEEIVKRLNLNPLEGEKNHVKPDAIISQIWKELIHSRRTESEFKNNFLTSREERLVEYGHVEFEEVYAEDAFKGLITLYKKLERIGKLISYRYLSKYINEFTKGITFNENGKSEINFEYLDELVTIPRTQEDHQKITKKYFPNFPIPQPLPRKQPPKFQQREYLNFAASSYLDTLFTKVSNNPVGSGNCCVGALAQGIFKDQNACSNGTFLTKIRKAAQAYMNDNPRQFFNSGLFEDAKNTPQDFRYNALVAKKAEKGLTPEEELELKKLKDSRYKALIAKKCLSPKEELELEELKIKKVQAYANSISGTEYFSLAAIKAISFIIGRPIYIVDEQSGHTPYKLTQDKSIEMFKVNDQIDGEILYLHLNGIHYSSIYPKRIGTQKI